MAYIPPAVHARPNRPAFVRPSGDGGASGFNNIRIVNMPRYGRLFIDEREWMGGGHWDEDNGAPNDWLVPNPPPGQVVRVENQVGQSRVRDFGRVVNFAEVETGDLDWNSMTPVEDADVGTLRIFGSPHTQLIVNGVLQHGTEAGGVVTYAGLPTGTYGVEVNAADGFSWHPVVTIGRGMTTQLPLVRPATPIAQSGPLPTVDFSMGGGFNIGGAGSGVASGFTITGIPSTATGMAVRIDGQNATGTLSGGVWTANGTLVAGRSVMAQVRLQSGEGLSSFLLAPVERRVDVPATGGVSVPFSSFVAPAAPAPSAPVTARLVVNGPVGWRVGVGPRGSNGTEIAYGAIPASGSMALDLAPGTYALRVDTDRGTGRLDAIDLPAAGRIIDARTWVPAFPAPAPTPTPPVDRGTQGGAGAGAGAGAGGGAPATTANLTVTGTAGWMLTLTPAGSSAFVNRLPILASGTIAFPVTPGSYTLKVEDGAGHMASQSITVPVAGLAVDVGPWLASQIRSAQGPTSADPAKGTVRLSGAPPQSVVAMPAAGLTHTVDATGRPVALDVLPGTYALTVTPIGSAPRAQSVTVVAGQTVDVTYGAMPTPSAQTDGTGLQPVDAMCGPVLNRAALPWAPATACPGNELTAPDGSRYRALASTGGVTLMQLKADGTVADAGMSLGTKVLIVGVVAAAGYAGWMWYSHRKPSGKQENPGKCSCGG